MTTLPSDHAQRLAALNPEASFIVQAPAGSGKTELLIQRFLVLLQRVKLPEEILAITFTNKAVNEMRHRLIQALASATTATPPSTPHKKLTWELAKKVLEKDHAQNWRLLENPQRLRIQTIDSLCRRINQSTPLQCI